jgi:two-component system, OmpR family, response regulator
MRILVIEDDKRLVKLIRSVLEEEGYNVDIANDGDTGVELALRGCHDVAIIDWMLPGRDGPSICRSIRSAHLSIATLLLTARSQIEDRVAGLDSGADDYLVKPFSFDELLARVRALGRRFTTIAPDAWELRLGNVVMDLQTHSLRRKDTVIDLTKTEWNLLELLLRHPGQVLSREQIIDYVWAYNSDVKPELVDVYVSYLRQKLNIPGLSDPIQTVRGVGYRLEPQYA